MSSNQKSGEFQINGFPIGGSRVFVIAEIGNNHQGDVTMAKKLVDVAIEAGADCVKFQIRNRTALFRIRENAAAPEDLGAEYIQDLLRRVELNLAEHQEVRRYCETRGVTYMCTPWDEPSVEALSVMNVPALKIASADLSNPYLITKAAALGVPLVLSTGMSFEGEIIRAIDQLKALGIPFALLHCNSTYPAPESDIQLPYIQKLKKLHPVIGYSGHERGTAITLAAVALGACIVERHITLDRTLEGPDHLASLEPDEFRQLVAGIRSVEKAMRWDGPGRSISQGELLNRENLAKSVVAACDIKKGEVLSTKNLGIASPGQGLAPYRLSELLGKQAIRALSAGDFLFESDIEGRSVTKRRYQFPIKWGIPVRYHDFKQFANMVEPSLFEFHLSYKDLSVEPRHYLQPTLCTRLVVHAPELFENSELLDLASEDEAYRLRSIDNLQRVVDATIELSQWFPKADSLLIVGNVGGFSADKPFPISNRTELYQRFREAYLKIRWGPTELIPQNMAPFPWHFGGQRYQNIFMMPDELVEQAEKYRLRYCLDLAHLRMTCTYFSLDFQSALNSLLPYTAHLHVSDAAGTNGEGVLMGTGDIQWEPAWRAICTTREISFIPEVWQGHKDHGTGFWHALDILRGIK